MFKKDHLLLGLLYGSIAPAFAWIIFDRLLHNDAVIMNKPGVPYLLAVAVNLILIRLSLKSGQDSTAKGIMLITFAVMVLVFVTKINIAA